MNISSISSNFSTYATTSSSSINSVSSLLTTYHDEVVTTSRCQDSVEISSAGLASMSTPPNFDSMSIDDFKQHLTDMQSTLTDMGYTTDLDISSLSDDELSNIKDSMAKQGGKNPPPPPPPSSSSSQEQVQSSDELLELFLQSISETEEETSYQTIGEMLSLYSGLN